MKDSPAEAGGMKAGDIITDFGGGPVKDVTELQKKVAAVEPGRTAPVVVIRDKASTPLTIKIGEQPGEEKVVAAAPREEMLGLKVEPLTPEAAQRFKLTAKTGVLVVDVAAGSSGEAAGIRPGDAILEVNRQPVGSVDVFKKTIAAAKPGDPVPVYLQRGGGRNEYVVLTVPEPKR
jgi:serine protease Do